jgi:hypothetical protein
MRWRKLLTGPIIRDDGQAGIKVVFVVVLLSWFSAVGIAFGLVADWAKGVSHSDAAPLIPVTFIVMAMLGHTATRALTDQERRIAKLEAELARRGDGG